MNYVKHVTDVKYLKTEAGVRRAVLDLSVPSTRANSFISDISRWFAPEHGNWLPAAAWVSLLALLDVPAATARTALHRMTQAGWLVRETRAGRRGYGPSPAARAVADAEEPGVAHTESEETWALIVSSIPESQRASRHVMRTLLGRLGFASLGNGVWIASAARLAQVQEVLEAGGLRPHVEIFTAEHQGFSDRGAFIRRCWDVDDLAANYRTFIEDVRCRLERRADASERTFVDVVTTINSWRRVARMDPALPVKTLPADWPRREAEGLRNALLHHFLELARQYVASVVASSPSLRKHRGHSHRLGSRQRFSRASTD